MLSEEMMLTAFTYRGEDLHKRGVPFPVLPREQVLQHAVELARSLAEKPRSSLVTLKDHLVAPLREALPGFIAQEIKMHELTFHQPEVSRRIEAFFSN